MSTLSSKDIMKEATKLFFKFGVQSVTVDDITNTLGISKKTFYEHYSNKSDLVEQIVNDIILSMDYVVEEIKKQNDCIDQIMMLYSFIVKLFSPCSVSFIHDIKKYYPSMTILFDRYKENVVDILLTDLIEAGKREGIFNINIDTDVIISTHWKYISNIIERKLLPRKNLLDPVFIQLIKTNIISITTIKGHELITQKYG
jgi:AcrR family transcriptional regulator